MTDVSTEQILAALSPEHREQVIKASARESVTVKVWLERAVERQSTQSSMSAQTAGSETLVENTSETWTETDRDSVFDEEARRAAASELNDGVETRSHTRSVHTVHRPADAAKTQSSETTESKTETIRRTTAKGSKAAGLSADAHESEAHEPNPRITRPSDQGVDDDEKLEVRRETETHRESGDRVIRDSRRIDEEVSTYHRHIAAEAAAAEGLPLTVWLEQAILERKRGREWETTRPHPGPARQEPQFVLPPPAPPQTVISETNGRAVSFDLLAALILGMLLTLLLLLILPWIWSTHAGPPNGPNGDNSSTTTVTTAGRPVLPLGGNVVVTTLVNGAAQAPGHRGWLKPQPANPPYIPDQPIQPMTPSEPPADCNCRQPAY